MLLPDRLREVRGEADASRLSREAAFAEQYSFTGQIIGEGESEG